jgi:hypothetical protein
VHGQRQPQPPPAVASVPQQLDFSEGAQQVSCSVDAQQADGSGGANTAVDVRAMGTPVAARGEGMWRVSVSTAISWA